MQNAMFLYFFDDFGALWYKSFQKNSSPHWGKDKQTLSSRRYLARVLSSLMYRYGLRPKRKRVCGS